MAKAKIDVKGMTCDHCRGRVENAAKAVAGVFAVYVDLAEGCAEVDFDETKTTAEDLVDAIQAAGYETTLSS